MVGSIQSFVRGVACLSLLTAVSAAPNPKVTTTCKTAHPSATPSGLPIVDLGYELHQASTFNETGRYYNFSNIRYAAPPVGNLRFRPPQAPKRNRTTVNTGNVKRICPQAYPQWSYGQVSEFVVYHLLGYNYSYTPLPATTTVATPDPSESEDCLFLDVFVPEDIYKRTGKYKNKKAPVLVWIYGGGYTGGSKSGSGSPSGLLERSEDAPTTGGLIYVAMNYRLGAFGFLSGDEVKDNGVANAGFYDQRFALEWVQENIHLFNGDPDQVTVIGESAGGGSIMHQITAFGGKKAPFQQAIAQSPGWNPAISNDQQDTTFSDFLKYANASSISDLRKASTETLRAANYLQIANSPWGSFTYGPVTDGNFVPAQPAELLRTGHFDHSLNLLVGHNALEGLSFTPPYVTTDAEFITWLTSSFEKASASTIQYIANKLYPPVYDGTYGYKTVLDRAILAVSEYVFTCNTFYLDLAYGNKTYAYEFAIPPAIHGQDVAYTYFTGNKNTPNAAISVENPYAITNVTVAIALQEFITSFAQTGKPVAIDGIPKFVTYGKDARIEVLNQASIYIGKDNTANQRCRWWQKGEYLG